MDNLFTLPVNIQIMLVAGFIGHYINSVGRKNNDIFLRWFQILVFGTLGGLVFLGLELIYKCFLSQDPNTHATTVVSGIVTIVSAMVLSVGWRKWGRAYWIKIARYWKVYSDDHLSSAYDSFVDMMPKELGFVDIELADGKTLRSDWDIVASRGINKDDWIAINHDGVSMYITSTFGLDGNETEHERDPSTDAQITYISIDQIARISAQ